MVIKDVKSKLLAILDSFRGALTDVGLENVHRFIRVGEYQLALEVLCEILHEDSIKISNDIYVQIEEVGKLLNLDSKYWEGLENTEE